MLDLPFLTTRTVLDLRLEELTILAPRTPNIVNIKDSGRHLLSTGLVQKAAKEESLSFMTK